LKAVLATSVARQEVIASGSKLWRAQLGHVWRKQDLGGGVVEDLPEPFDVERMKPLRRLAQTFFQSGGSPQQSRGSAADLQNRLAFRLRRGLPDNPVILSVRSDPEPIDSLLDASSQRPVMFADAHAPKIADPLEMQGRVTRIGLEEGKVLVS
jgi:hypothetical protein